MAKEIAGLVINSIPILSQLLNSEPIDIQFEIVPNTFNSKGFVVDADRNYIECGDPDNIIKGEFIWKIKTTITNLFEKDIFIEQFQVLSPTSDIFVDGYDMSRIIIEKGKSIVFFLRIHNESDVKVKDVKRYMHQFPFCIEEISLHLVLSFSWLWLRPKKKKLVCLNGKGCIIK